MSDTTQNISQEEINTQEDTSGDSSQMSDTEVTNEVSENPTLSNTDREALLRLKADYDNLVKRHDRERKDMKSFFTKDIVNKLLPTYDTLARIVEQSNKDTSSETLLTGVQSAKDIFERALNSIGINKFQSVGEEVDPARHDVMSQ